MNSVTVRSNNLSLKYERFTTPGCKGIGFRKFEFVTKTLFLSYLIFESLILFQEKRTDWTRPLKRGLRG